MLLLEHFLTFSEGDPIIIIVSLFVNFNRLIFLIYLFKKTSTSIYIHLQFNIEFIKIDGVKGVSR